MSNKKWLIAAILLFITILTWVISDIVHTRSEIQIPQNVQQIIEPINPNFNTQILSN